ncbi:MAG: c-type cytochrome [Alphaproteobacteria bacterium]
MRTAKFLVVVGLGAVLGFGGAAAQERIEGDFDLEETVQICAACHGEDGVPVEADIPVLWGQQFYYLYVQMKDYKAGRRASETMQPMVKGFSRDQMKALATYFSERAWPDVTIEKNADRAGAGLAQAAAGQCAQCHNKYLGDSRVPRVAGQQEAYLLRTMLEFKGKVRLNSPAKGSLLKSYEDASIEELAHFLATL